MEDQSLVDAVIANDLTKIQEALRSCPDTARALHTAIRYINIAVVSFLLKNGADPNAEDSYGQTPLKIAATRQQNSDEMVQMLLENGADVNNAETNGRTDFLHIMQNGALSYKNILSLLDTVTNIHELDVMTGESFLHMTRNRESDSHTTELIEQLIMMGISVNIQDNEGDTPLHNLASVSNVEGIRALISNGADVNIENSEGQSPIHRLGTSGGCSKDNVSEALKILIEQGLSINALDLYGRTALHLAVIADEDKESVEALMNYGIRTNVSDKLGRNEIYYAAMKFDPTSDENEIRNCFDIMEILATTGVSINQRDIFGLAPIHIAAFKTKEQLLQKLLTTWQADCNVLTNTMAVALHWSCNRVFLAFLMIDFYVKNGLNLNVKDTYGSTPLHWAVWFRDHTVIKMLLQNGCDVRIRDNRGLTAGELATKLMFEDFYDICDRIDELDKVNDINEIHFDYHGTDPFEECPLLTYIDIKDNELDIEGWQTHFEYHKELAGKFITHILKSSFMGCYHDMEDNVSVTELIGKFINTVHQKVAEKMPIFKSIIRLAGGMNELTKVDHPNEFDFIWNFTEFQKVFEPFRSDDCPDGFLKLKLRDLPSSSQCAFSEFIDEHGFLVGRKLCRRFYRAVNNAIINIFKDEATKSDFSKLAIHTLFDEDLGGIADIQCIYQGPEIKLSLISIDLVPAVSVGTWEPPNFSRESLKLVKCFMSKPQFSVVIKSPDKNFVRSSEVLYRTSYASLENEIVRSIPCSVRKGYIIMKALQQSYYMPIAVDENEESEAPHFPTTYQLKTCFLHELECALESGEIDLSSDNDAPNSEISICWAKRIINRLSKCVENKNLPSYFEPNKNLLAMEGTSIVFREPILQGFVLILKRLVETAKI